MNIRWNFWRNLERGQAMSEYWPTFPAAIAILISAGTLVSILQSAYLRTNEGLQRQGMPVEVCNKTSEDEEGPTSADIGHHLVQLTASNYNPATNTTTVIYRVTSGSQPSISHWVLGVPRAVANNVTSVNEQYAWTDQDPTTLLAGIKFDTGYEGGGGSGDGGNGGSGGSGDGGNGGSGGSGDGSGKGDKGKGGQAYHALPRQLSNNFSQRPVPVMGFGHRASPFIQLSGSTTTFDVLPTGEGRDIAIVLTGQYEYQTVTVAIKAGTETYSGSIIAPVLLIDPNAQQEEDLTETDNLYTGCN